MAAIHHHEADGDMVEAAACRRFYAKLKIIS
jgi:hypothetical protein